MPAPYNQKFFSEHRSPSGRSAAVVVPVILSIIPARSIAEDPEYMSVRTAWGAMPRTVANGILRRLGKKPPAA